MRSPFEAESVSRIAFLLSLNPISVVSIPTEATQELCSSLTPLPTDGRCPQMTQIYADGDGATGLEISPPIQGDHRLLHEE